MYNAILERNIGDDKVEGEISKCLLLLPGEHFGLWAKCQLVQVQPGFLENLCSDNKISLKSQKILLWSWWAL